MTGTIAPAATDLGGSRVRLRRLVAALAVTQTVGYGVLYYAFSVLITPMAADLHTSTPRIAAALTVSVLISAVVAVPVGRWLDHHGGRCLMAVGSLLGVIAVAAWSQVRTPTQLCAVFVVIGIASAMSLYEAAFSVVIAAAEPAARNRSLLAVTVVAGFASSIFFPLTGWLAEAVGWRTTLVVLALLLAITAIPGHLLAVPRSAVHRVQTRTHVGQSVAATLRDTRFWLLGFAFVLQTAATAAVGVLLVTVLRGVGHSATTAATLAGLLGVLSVTGRLATTALARRFGIAAVTAGVFAVQAAGIAALPFVSDGVIGAAVCVIAFGVGFGVSTIAKPAILAERYGTTRYATIAGTIAVPITLAKAVAPMAAALLVPRSFMILAAVACLVASVLLPAAGRSTASAH
jgi:predicted MFS family arabinose efflux permease